jgi:hypothetical protein
MRDLSHLGWRSFDGAHRQFAAGLAHWSEQAFTADINRADAGQHNKRQQSCS